VALLDILSPEFIVGIIVVIFVLVILASGIRVIREWERAPVLRLGRFTGLKGPGIFYIIPFIDRIPSIVTMRVQTTPFRTEQTLTKDNVPVNVDAIMFFQAVDVQKVILNVERFLDATTWAAQTTLREVIGKVSLDELLAEREKVGVEARNIIDEKTARWRSRISQFPACFRKQCLGRRKRSESAGQESPSQSQNSRPLRRWLRPQTSTRRTFERWNYAG